MKAPGNLKGSLANRVRDLYFLFFHNTYICILKKINTLWKRTYYKPEHFSLWLRLSVLQTHRSVYVTSFLLSHENIWDSACWNQLKSPSPPKSDSLSVLSTPQWTLLSIHCACQIACHDSFLSIPIRSTHSIHSLDLFHFLNCSIFLTCFHLLVPIPIHLNYLLPTLAMIHRS